MTAAGVATLFITDDMLHGQEGANCNGNVTDKNIDAGLHWMGEHFDQVKDNYALYGVGAHRGRQRVQVPRQSRLVHGRFGAPGEEPAPRRVLDQQ